MSAGNASRTDEVADSAENGVESIGDGTGGVDVGGDGTNAADGVGNVTVGPAPDRAGAVTDLTPVIRPTCLVGSLDHLVTQETTAWSTIQGVTALGGLRQTATGTPGVMATMRESPEQAKTVARISIYQRPRFRAIMTRPSWPPG